MNRNPLSQALARRVSRELRPLRPPPVPQMIFGSSEVDSGPHVRVRSPKLRMYVMTNHTNINTDPRSSGPANRIAMYHRARYGTLVLLDYFDTGGQGSGPGQRFAGNGLGSSLSVQLSDDRCWLFVTNAGSGTAGCNRIPWKPSRWRSRSLIEGTGDLAKDARVPQNCIAAG